MTFTKTGIVTNESMISITIIQWLFILTNSNIIHRPFLSQVRQKERLRKDNVSPVFVHS